MILIDETKYSCIECIRGHRSSLCRHHTRPLLQVRSKGRPNVHANGNPNHRIAVFAEEIDHNEIKSLNENCGSKKNPVIILKASPKQVIDLKNGHIIGPYEEDSCNVNDKPPAPIINSDSFINTSSCCLNGISKPKKNCGCSNKTNTNINKQEILKKYLQKHTKPSSGCKFIDYSKKIQIKNEDDNDIEKGGNDNDGNDNDNIEKNQEKLLFDVVKIPSCTIPGSCGCDNTCSCEGCFVHGNANLNELNNNQFNNLLNYANKNDLKISNSVINTYNTQTNLTAESNLVLDDSLQNTGSNDHLQNFHNDNSLDAGQNLTLIQNNTSTQPRNDNDNFLHNQMYNLQPNLDLQNSNNHAENSQNQNLIQGTNKEKTYDYPPCSCSSDCDCFNCETHGIINGTRLDELFNSVIPMDYKDIINSIGLDKANNISVNSDHNVASANGNIINKPANSNVNNGCCKK